jgi:FkbM family methyltransferase
MGYYIKYEQEVAQSRWDLEVNTYLIPNPQFTHRLGPNSVVIDVGGYLGDWSDEMAKRYDPWLTIFEPIREYALRICERFKDNPKVRVYSYALSAHNDKVEISRCGNRSSFYKPQGLRETVLMRDVAGAGLPEVVDLISINIEGGEYELLPRMIEFGIVRRCHILQIQFHTSYPNAGPARERLRASLAQTHDELYCYPFVWEAWKRK